MTGETSWSTIIAAELTDRHKN